MKFAYKKTRERRVNTGSSKTAAQQSQRRGDAKSQVDLNPKNTSTLVVVSRLAWAFSLHSLVDVMQQMKMKIQKNIYRLLLHLSPPTWHTPGRGGEWSIEIDIINRSSSCESLSLASIVAVLIELRARLTDDRLPSSLSIAWMAFQIAMEEILISPQLDQNDDERERVLKVKNSKNKFRVCAIVCGSLSLLLPRSSSRRVEKKNFKLIDLSRHHLTGFVIVVFLVVQRYMCSTRRVSNIFILPPLHCCSFVRVIARQRAARRRRWRREKTKRVKVDRLWNVVTHNCRPKGRKKCVGSSVEKVWTLEKRTLLMNMRNCVWKKKFNRILSVKQHRISHWTLLIVSS